MEYTNYSYSYGELKRILAAEAFCDNSLSKGGYDAEELRTLFIRKCHNDKLTQTYTSSEETNRDDQGYIVESVSHTVDGKYIWGGSGKFPYCSILSSFDTGIILKYYVNYSSVLVIKFDPTIVVGEVDGEEIRGSLEFELHNIVTDDFAEDGSLTWGAIYGGSYSLLDLFNTHPKILKDLCNHDEIGALKLLKILNV